MVKEHVGLVLLPYCIIAIAGKRNWRWIIYPVVLSIVWIAITFLVIIPAYRPDDCLIYAHYTVKSHGEAGIKGLVVNILTNPMDTIETITSRFYFLYIYFSQGLFILPFFSQGILFLFLPLVKIILFFPYDPPVIFHHSMISAPFLFYSMGQVYTRIIRKDSNRDSKNRFIWKHIITFLFLGIVVVNMPVWLPTVNLEPGNDLSAMREAVMLVPDGARVAAPMNMTPKLAHRCEVVYLDYVTIQGEDAVDYIIINTNRDYRPIRRMPKKEFLETGTLLGYAVFWQRGGVYLLRKNSKEHSCRQEVKKTPPKPPFKGGISCVSIYGNRSWVISHQIPPFKGGLRGV